MKKLSLKSISAIIAAIIILFLIMSSICIMVFRIDSTEARNKALEQSGGGEIISEQIESEDLFLNEYSYIIINGDNWYDIEINGFGQIKEIKQGTGNYPLYKD